MEARYGMADAFVDARRYGRALLFDSSIPADALQAAAAEQWQLEPVPLDSSLIAQAEIAPGLHLNLDTAYQPGKYELILLREPQISQEEAGRVWAETISSLWRLVEA